MSITMLHRALLARLALAVAVVGATGAGTVGCGPGILTPSTPPPPLFTLQVDAQNALNADIDGPVRGALAWTVYSDELVACMDGVELNGLIDLSQSDPEDPFDPAVRLVRQIQSCMLFSERGHEETASVAVEPVFPSSFTIPVAALPDEAVLTGSPGARLGIGDVIVYTDDNGDEVFTETPLGAGSFVDSVVGTSRAIREEDIDESFVVYREGELSSVWKVYRGIYGCADPPQGFSTVTLRFTEAEPFIECTIDDTAIPVELDTTLGSLGCAADADQYAYQKPGDEGLPAGAVGECVYGGDGWYDVLFTSDVDSVCPDVGRFDLVGCSDLTSEQACRATSWDLVLEQPSWWPCKFGAGEIFMNTLDEEAPATDGLDTLFTLQFGDGFGSFPLDSIQVAVVIDDDGTEALVDGLTLVDNDGNGAFSTGDELVVSETVDTFDAASTPGNYLIVVRVDGVALGGTGYRGFQPVEIPVLPAIVMEGADAPAPITFGADDVALARYVSGDAGAFAVEDVRVQCYLGGERPVLFALGDEEFIEGTLALSSDADGDGLFGPGDELVLRERENVPFALDPDGIQSFSNALYCSVTVDVGFEAFVYVGGGFEVTLDGAAD